MITTFHNANKADIIEDLLKIVLTTTSRVYQIQNKSKLAKYGDNLRKRYIEEIPCSLDWPPSMTDKTFNLAMIKHEMIRPGKINDEYIQKTITGKVDDILQEKTPIKLEDILKIIHVKRKVLLLEGAPGSGKTTLTLYIRQKWCQGELFQEYLAIVIVQLRDPTIQRAKTIADLLPCSDKAMGKEIAREIAANDGDGVLWILDGWDELPPRLQRRSLFRDIIFPPTNTPVSKSTVVITSRPISAIDLQRCIHNRIEILGFRTEELKLYFKNCLKSEAPAVVEDLFSKISENPALKSSCYLPLNAAIVAYVYQYNDHKLPNTQYEMFSTIILTLIFRHIQKQGKHCDLTSLESFDELPEDLTHHFRTICKLAYEGIMESKVAFHSKDLQRNFNSLGLLHTLESCSLVGSSTFYYFRHLTFQELLAAHHIATCLSANDQVAMFKDLFQKPRFSVVFQFYAAISKLEKPGFPEVVSRIVSNSCYNQHGLLALLHCIHEVQDPNLCRVVAKKIQNQLELVFVSLSAADCLAIGYFLSKACTPSAFTANLSFSYIGDEGCKFLLRDLIESATNSGQLSLCLPAYQFQEDGLQVLAHFLQSEGSKVLHSLTLGYKEPGHVVFHTVAKTTDILSPLSTALTVNNTLVELSLKKCDIRVTGINGRALAEMLRLNKSLQVLNLKTNPKVGDCGAFYIAEGIKSNTSLKTLNISKCGLTSKGANDIARALVENKTIQSLSIDKNDLLDAGVVLLAKALKQNVTLTDLNLTKCGMTDASLNILGACLVENKSIKVLQIGDDNRSAITENGMVQFIEHLSQRTTALECLGVSRNMIYTKAMREIMHNTKFSVSTANCFEIYACSESVY